MFEIDKSIESLFELRHLAENVFFRKFLGQYDFEDGMNQSGTMAVMILFFHGKLPMKHVSEALNMEKGSFTPVANKLIKNGYINKTRDENDKRVYYLEVTEKGKTFAEKFGQEHVDYVNGLINALTEIEKQTLFDAVKVVNGICKKVAKQ